MICRKTEAIQTLESGKLPVDGRVDEAVSRVCSHLGLDYKGEATDYDPDYPQSVPGKVKWLWREFDKLKQQIKTLEVHNTRLINTEAWINRELVPYAEIEYTYTIEPGYNPSREGETSSQAWYWKVITNSSPYAIKIRELDREVGSGTVATHAEAWAAIKEAILNHKADSNEARVFSNMHESKGTVRW